MLSDDPRANFLFETASSYFSVPLKSVDLDKASAEALSRFLNENKCSSIAFCWSRLKRKLTCSELVPTFDDNDSTLCIAFYKTKPVALDRENLQEIVSVVSVHPPTVAESLLGAVEKVFAPPILRMGSATQADVAVQHLVNELQTDLTKVLSCSKRWPEDGAEHERLKYDFYSLTNEVTYWSSIKNDANPDRSEFFCATLKSVAEEFESLSSMSFIDASSLMERTQNAFEELWAQQAFEPYPEARMLNLLQVVENQIVSLVHSRLRTLKFWNEKHALVREQLLPALSLCDQWKDACTMLTGSYWKKWVTWKWQGDTYSCPRLQRLSDRLRQLLSLCAGKQILSTLVDQHTVQDMDMLWQFPPEFNPLYCNDDQWKKQAEKIERKFGALTREILLHVKLLATNPESSSLHETLQRFLKYKDLLCIPLVKHEISAERETLLFRVTEQLKLNQECFRRKTGSWAVFPKTGLSDATVLIARTKQEEMQISELLETVAELVDDLPGFSDLREKCAAFKDELKTYRDDTFQRWCQDTMRAMDDSKNPLKLLRKAVDLKRNFQVACYSLVKSCRVMELDHKSGTMRVNYSDELVRLAKDVRQLLSLGYKMPQRIQLCAQNGQKFLKYALIMKQVAHFYNNAEAEVLPCLQAMMLNTAYAFERLISGLKSSHGENSSSISVTWEKSEDLENYLTKLKSAAERTANLSRMFLYYHQQIGQKIDSLKETSLLGQQLIWRETLLQAGEIFDEAERLGASAENMKPWRIHWDMELLKVLEHQYQMGLEKLNETMPSLQAELRLVQTSVKLYPSEEELRAKYAKEMKRFIDIPINFKGFLLTVPSERSIFAKVVEQNSKRIEEAYGKMNDFFKQLEDVLEQYKKEMMYLFFKDLGIIGEPNLEELIASKFREPSDWEAAFREIKIRGKAMEKMPRSIIVCSMVINTEPLKVAAESRLQQAYETLLTTLRLSCLCDYQQANGVLLEAVKSLCERPQSAEEVKTVQSVYLNFAKKKAEIDTMATKLEAKHQLYKNVSGSGIQEMNQTRQLVQQFNSALALHQKTMDAQIELLKKNFSSRIQTHKQAVEKFAVKWYQFKPLCDAAKDLEEDKLMEIANLLSQRRSELDEFLDEAEQLRIEAEDLGLDKPDFSNLEEVKRSLISSEAVWQPYQQFTSTLNELGKEEWLLFRTKLHVFADFLNTWKEKLKNLPVNFVTGRVQASLNKYLALLPHLKFCIGEHFDSDHWVEFCRLLKLPPDVKYDKLVLRNLLLASDNIIDGISNIKKLNSSAQVEVSIREAIAELDTWAATCTFQLNLPSDKKHQTPGVITNWNDVLNQVHDKQALLESIKKSSLNNVQFDKRTFWQESLVDLNERIQCLHEVQRRWVYLEPIFSKGVLPKDWSRFQKVDHNFRAIMSRLEQDSRVMNLRSPDISKIQFSSMREQLLECQKALNYYLEKTYHKEKRCQFPRFYFVGDDDLLAILGQADQPDIIKAHIQKLFPSVSTVHFSPSSKSLTAIVSADGEVVQLRKAVEIIENDWAWLKTLEESIKYTLKNLLQAALSAINKGIPLDPSKYPCQILCLAERIRFCNLCEKALQSKTLRDLHRKLKIQINTYASIQPDSVVLQSKLKALTLDAVHAVVVLDDLIEHESDSTGCWYWQKQLRFYVEAAGDVVIKQLDASFKYGFEYTGQITRLVQTPLTDRCFLTFTQAMKLGFCANPYGPTGTGKTETVKALGSLLGRTVHVFNCDESADVRSMARMFAGLVQCGAWGCFDEFNRLEESVMSVIAMHIKAIQCALQSGSERCKLLDREVPLNSNSAIFITLNPAGKHYGGRQKIPDNLKLLFRPVAMLTADDEIIAENLLLAEGFTHSKVIGAKLVCLFKTFRQVRSFISMFTSFDLFSDTLSKQQHYDWGLRTLKSVTTNAGHFHRTMKLNIAPAQSVEEKEASIVMMALRMNCLSKLTDEDSKTFDALLRQVFINVQPTSIPSDSLSSAIESAFSAIGFFPTDTQKIKVQELYEQLQQRTGVIILGQSGSGKTTLWKILLQALSQMKQTVKAYHFNPNAMTKRQLLGYVNPDTREWCDGLLPFLCRKSASEEVWSFIVCDGEIEPEWIEALNSVFDDNKLLTLTSGERIRIGSNVSFIFECTNLHSASPATVSRMGFVYLSTGTVGVEAQLRRFVQTQAEVTREQLSSWLQNYFESSLAVLFEVMNGTPIERGEHGKIVNGLSLLNDVRMKRDFLLKLCRGLGGNLERKSKEEFTVKLFEMAGERPPDLSCPVNITYDAKNDAYITFDGCIEESFIPDVRAAANVPLAKSVTICEAHETLNVLMYEGHRPFILAGPTGCGKCYPSEPELHLICTTFLKPVLRAPCVAKLVQSVDAIASSFVRAMVSTIFDLENCMNYAFTPTDLICWALGLSRYVNNSGTLEELVSIWLYEGRCIFEDRLVTHEEKERFKSVFREILENEKITVLDGIGGGESMYYVSFSSGSDLKVRSVESDVHLCRIEIDAISSVLEKAISTFKYEMYDLNIVIIDELVKLVVRMDRAIHSSYKNSVVLIGPSGLGRRTAISLLAYVLQLRTISLTIVPGYDYKNYKSSLKQVIQAACTANEPLVFIVEDYQLLSAEFYDPIYSLLKCGEIPGLFKPEEIEPLLNNLREQAFQDSYEGTLYSYFTHRVKRNLRLILVLDVGDSLLIPVSRRYADCFRECTVISFDKWTTSSMVKTAQYVLNVHDGKEIADETISNTKSVSSFPETAQMVYCTVVEQCTVPRKYIAFLNQIKKFQFEKSAAIRDRLSVLKSGISKLNEARSVTEKLKSEADHNSNLLIRKQKEADGMLEEITESITAANNQKSNMEALKRKREDENQLLEEQRNAIEAKLSKIEPLIKQAKEDVQSIRADSLSEIRSLRAPPETIRDILEAVLLFMGIYDCSWASMRTFLSKSAVKEEIINFDAHRINPQSLEKVSELVKRKSSSFEPSNAKRASAAAAPLAAWVVANMKYADILNKIAPLEQKKQKLQKSIKQMERQIDSIRSGLQSADESASQLRAKFHTLTSEASEIKFKLDNEGKTLQAAETLTAKLGSEYDRWTLQLSSIHEELENLPRLALLAAMFLHFMIKQPESTRKRVMKSLQGVISTEGFDFLRFMGTDVNYLNFKREGLPDEETAVENALAVLNGCQVALLLDPSQQSMAWLVKHLEKESKVEAVSQKNANYVTQLELSIRFGKTLILFDVNGIDPVLHAVLRDQFIYQVESGLTSQLLSLTIREMNPDLEKRRSEVLEEYEDMKCRLESTEEAILSQLATLKGGILEDCELLETLNAAKQSSAKLEMAMKESFTLRSKVEAERTAFLPLAKVACSVYFVIAELHNLCEVYNYSLQFFMKLYSSFISKQKNCNANELSITKLRSTFIWNVIDTVGRSVFQREHMIFVFRLVLAIYPEHFRSNEWECFLRISEASGLSLKAQDFPEWTESYSKQGLTMLKTFLPELYNSLDLANKSQWNRFMEAVACEDELPAQLKSSTSLFQQLLIVATLRQDRLLSSMNSFLNKVIGRESWKPHQSQLSHLLPESTCNEPVLIISTFGADPSVEVEELASSTVGPSNYVQLAMGNEECDLAITLIQECATKGKWLCLKNLHLVTGWVPSMEAELNRLKPTDSFRLWLITERNANFQCSFLRNCLKFIYEAPSGLKQNLLQTWSSQEASALKQLPTSNIRAAFALSLLHAICQERRTYIPQGWCKFYEFTYSDFKTGLDIANTWLTNKTEESWQFVREVLENVIYGCRIEDAADATVLRILLAELFNKNLASDVPNALLGKLALPRSNLHEGKQISKLRCPMDATSRKKLSPIETFALKEHSLAVQLACVIHADLTIIHKAIQLNIPYGSDSKRAIFQLFNNETPDSWQALWDGPSQPMSFLKVMASKSLDIYEWLERGVKSNLLAEPVNISMFFRPEAFLSSFRQQTALRQNIGLDMLVFQLAWSNDSPISLPCRFIGLRIEGAVFDGKVLREVNPSSPPVSQVPDAVGTWLPSSFKNIRALPTVSVPLYYDERRKSVLTFVDIPCSEDPKKWLLAKVALFL
ncbi:dynein heavy chain [Trichuris trichiura]|uniref:Cytoplasmic dynein 2 heavy chain 1 n=1 Tax=Trichuris trichiura TaxID=36087 RepID=A0A077Z9T7_TRITR|nr:dynein heavy chain [Trichuris trichiura]